MIAARFDLLGIGNAIVDVLAPVDDTFLDEHGLVKGSQLVVDEATALRLYGAMGSATEVSGGSAGNTAAGITSLGGRAAFVGKVRDDVLGRFYRQDLHDAGVCFDTSPATSGPATARSMILVSPDAQRTMNTHLGASWNLGVADIDPSLAADARVTYLEGFMWDSPYSAPAMMKALDAAAAAGRTTALCLADSFCVERHYDIFVSLVRDRIDLAFGNAHEFTTLFGADSVEGAIEAARTEAKVAIITLGADGAVVVSGSQTYVVPADPVPDVVDTTGAGDLFAAGFLFGHTRGLTLPECALLGHRAAGEVISHVGARPRTALSGLLATRGS